MGTAKIVRRNLSQRSGLISDMHEYGINADSREIFVHGHIDNNGDEEPGVDYRMAGQFIKNMTLLTHLSREESILIHMITCGGDWSYGMAMYDAIAGCPCSVTVLSYAHARSMSSIIIQAADYRVLQPHTDFLIHHGTYGFEGNHTSAESEWKQARISTEQMMKIYTDKAKNGTYFKEKKWGEARIKKYLDTQMKLKQEWYMDSRQAISYGLVDAVLGDEGYEDIETLRHE